MKKHVTVSQQVEVEIDETKFTPEFLAEFRSSFYQFDTVDEHVGHLAQLYARGLIADFGDPFIEGYGHQSEMGIRLCEVRHSLETEIVEAP